MRKYWLAAALILMSGFIVSQSLAATFIISTSDSPITPGMDNQGWWGTTPNTPSNDNYATGNETDLSNFVKTRSYFSFDLAGVFGTVTSATLEVRRYVTDAGAILSLYDVSTSASALAQRGPANAAIYADLGSGVSYGSFTAGAGNTFDIMSFALNASALTDINAALGLYFSIGGSASGGLFFGGSNSEPGNGGPGYTQQLVLTTAAAVVPVPGAVPLFATGLAGLVWLARRKKKTAAGA